MSPPRVGVEEIDAALEGLALIADLTRRGRSTFNRSQELRLSLAMCWVSVGSQVKQFCRLRGVTIAGTELSRPVRLRDKLSYQSLSELDATVLWDTCVHDTTPLTELLAGLRSSL